MIYVIFMCMSGYWFTLCLRRERITHCLHFVTNSELPIYYFSTIKTLHIPITFYRIFSETTLPGANFDI